MAQIIGDRKTQEDFCAIRSGAADVCLTGKGAKAGTTKEEVIGVLCDGMGGHNAGEIAARTAAITFIDATHRFLRDGQVPSQAFLKACHAANAGIREKIRRDAALDGMGTTIVGVRLKNNEMNWISVGDSHLLLFRNKRLVKLNQDHSMRPVIDEMVAKDLILLHEARSHPDRNALRSAVMGEELSIVDTGIEKFFLKRGDILLLASDGIDILKQDTIIRILRCRLRSLASRAAKIISTAARQGGRHQDNTTVLLFRIAR